MKITSNYIGPTAYIKREREEREREREREKQVLKRQELILLFLSPTLEITKSQHKCAYDLSSPSQEKKE